MTFHKSIVRPEISSLSIMINGGLSVTPTDSSSPSAFNETAETTIIIGEGDVVITADYDECTCQCHQSGISAFFFRIILFFQKLFGMNAECICGARH
jgi:hypothetical protein